MNRRKKIILYTIGSSLIMMLIFSAIFASLMYKKPQVTAKFTLENNLVYKENSSDDLSGIIGIYGYAYDSYGGSFVGVVGFTEEEDILIQGDVTILLKAGDVIKNGEPVARHNLTNEVYYADEYTDYKVDYIEVNEYGQLITIYNPDSIGIKFSLPLDQYKALAGDDLKITVSLYGKKLDYTEFTYKLNNDASFYIFALTGIDTSLHKGLYVTVEVERRINYDYAKIEKNVIAKIADNLAYIYILPFNYLYDKSPLELVSVTLLYEDEFYCYVKSDTIDFSNVYIFSLYN
jgi:hypothetical protein